MLTKKENYTLKTKIMKKNIIAFLFLIGFLANAQNFRLSNYSVLNERNIENYERAFFHTSFYDVEDYETQLKNFRNDNRSIKNPTPDNNGRIEVSSHMDGGFYAITTYKNGIADGKKTVYYNNGDIYQEIPYTNGKINGIVKIYKKYEQILAEIPYKNNLKEGIKKVFYDDERSSEQQSYIIEGKYIAGKLADRIMVTSGDLKILFPNDFNRGKIEMYYKDLLLTEYSIFNRTTEHGDYYRYSYTDEKNPKNRNIDVKAHFTLGKLDGYLEEYKNGELVSKNLYRNDKPIGNYRTYYKKDVLKEDFYYDEQGNKTGKWTTYNYDGKIAIIQNYLNNKLDGVTEYYNSGILNRSESYKNNVLDGVSKIYDYKTGKLKTEDFYEKGNFKKEIEYLYSGKVKSIYLVSESKTYYDKNGNTIATNVFKNGKQIGEHKAFNYDEEDNYKLYQLTKYDDNGKQTLSIWYNNNDNGFTEKSWLNGMQHGKTRIVDKDGKEKIIFYFKNKEVTEEEYNKLTKEELKKK